MSNVRKSLKAARDALAAKNYEEVIQHCKAALKEDSKSYEAFVYIGKAAFNLGEYEKAELSYLKATSLSDKAPEAWQGLSELYHTSQQWGKAVDADQTLVNLAHRGNAALSAKLPALVRRLADAHTAAGQLEDAEVALREVLGLHDLPPSERLPVLARLADVQLKEDGLETSVKVAAKLAEKVKEAGGDASKVCEEAVRSAVMSELADEALELDCDHATPTLKEIMCSVPPLPGYVRFHDTYLRKLRQAVNVAAPGSMDRHNRRVAVLEVCRIMIEGRCAAAPEVCQGCSSPYAFETALRLLEIEEEIVGARMTRSTSQGDFGGLPRSSSYQAFSGIASPHSGMATPTGPPGASGAGSMLAPGGGGGGGMFSPGPGAGGGGGGGFFGSLAHRGSLGALGEAAFSMGLRSGAMTPLETFTSGALPPTAPMTPKRDVSAARLTDLVMHPMAAATAAAGQSMAQQERESFSQLAAEASAPTGGPGATANGTPSCVTPVGSVGGAPAPIYGLPAALSSLSLGPSALITRNSSVDLTGASPRYAGTPSALTPKASVAPLAAPVLMADREGIACKLMHAFPWNPTAQVHLAMALRRRESYMDSQAATIKLTCQYRGPHMTDLACTTLAQRVRAERPRQLARRAWLVNTLAKGLSSGAPVVTAMIGLAELRLDAGDAVGALEAAKRGIKFVFDRNKIGKERARHAALMLNLLAAQALLASGQVTDAGRIFVRLAGRVSEGEVGFGSEAVGMPATSIRQQAIRGLAQCALAQGDACQALHHYGELVSKALMGRGSAEHWAYAEYGWLLFQEGNADAGRYQLETAISTYRSQTGLLGSDTVLAGYHLKLGRIYWALGGELRREREHCHAELLEAAAEEGPQQAEAFEWLGHWYKEVAGDELHARKCYQRALAINPTLAGAGNALCNLLSSRAAAAAAAAAAADPSSSAALAAAAAADSQLALEGQLLEELLVRAPDAHWARARLAGLQLQLREYDAAVGSYQAAIRSSPKSSELWEGLGASYQALGRHASALKSYGRALELNPARPYCLMSAAALDYMAGAYISAAERYRAALQIVPQHPAALLGLAEVLLSSAGQHMAMGATGAASVELQEAAELAAAAVGGVKSGPAAVGGAAGAGTAGATGAAAAPSTCAAAAAVALLTPSPGVARSSGSTSGTMPAQAGAAGSVSVGEQQQAALPECFQHSSNIVTAWKLLGDILLQQHLLQPSVAGAGAGAGDADAAIAGALEGLRARQGLVTKARRAYAHALMLNPTAGEVWGDVAQCYSHQARLLLELQPLQQQQQQLAPGTAAPSTTLLVRPGSTATAGVGSSTADAVRAARLSAVAAARGGLRLRPASSWLWGVLGRAAASAGDAAAAEYAYSRALSLDPKAAMLWVQLGRLYSRYGSVELAEQCYEAARGVEPTLVPVWEGMAATAAAGGSAAGAAAAAAAAEHAVGLGGGPESWLEYAVAGFQRHTPSQEGLLLACASKAATQQPLLLPPTAALAAALETRGNYASAAAALRYCLALLQAAQQHGEQGLAALGLQGFNNNGPQDTAAAKTLTHQLLLVPPAGSALQQANGGSSTTAEVLEGSAGVQAVSTALQVALARNLCLAGEVQDSLALYQQLEADGVLSTTAAGSSAVAYSWLCYGAAAQAAGEAALAARAMQAALESAAADGCADVQLAAVSALLQQHIQAGSLETGFSLLLQHLPLISSSSDSSLVCACVRPWLSLLVAAAVAGQEELYANVAEVMGQWAQGHTQLLDTAWLASEQQCIKAGMAAAGGDKTGAALQLSHAVHSCPWNTHAQVAHANAALEARPCSAPAVYRTCPALLPETAGSSDVAVLQAASSITDSTQQQSQPQHMGVFAERYSQHSISDVLAAACSRATALSGQVAAAVAATSGQEVARLQRLLHALPGSADLWYCLSLAALLQAIGDGQCSHFRKALRCCSSALQAVRQLMQQHSGGPSSSSPAADADASAAGVSLASCSLQQLQEVEVRLMVAISECHQHSRLPGCHDAAHHWAMDALAAAMKGAGGSAAATAHRQVGRMLASEGMAVEAEMAYRQAVAASGGQCPAAQLELAKLLVGQGRQQEAVQLLHTIWQAAAEGLEGVGTAAGGGGQDSSSSSSASGNQLAEAAALEEALLLADMGQIEAARAAAAAGLRLATTAGESAPAAAELVTATVALEAAAAAAPDAKKNLLLEARWAASSAAKSGMALPGTVGTAAAGVGAAVLAQTELQRNRPDKAYDAIGMSFGAWVDHAVPPQLLMAAGALSGELADCAAAVHTAPWMRATWERLQLAAAAQGRPILID